MISEIERLIMPKSGSSGADAVIVTGDFAAVVDGTTVSERCECCGDRAGQLMAALVVDGIAELAPDADLASFLRLSNIRTSARTEMLDCRGRSWVASAAIYSDFRREVWLVGDAAVLVDGTVHRAAKKIDRIAAEFRSVVIRAAMAGGATVSQLLINDVGRAAITPLLVRQRHLRNNRLAGDLAWAALAPEQTPIELCHSIAIPPHSGRDLVLASDGYPELLPTLAESEAALARCVAQDPLMIGPTPATKGISPGARSFDDRAYLRIRLSD